MHKVDSYHSLKGHVITHIFAHYKIASLYNNINRDPLLENAVR